MGLPSSLSTSAHADGAVRPPYAAVKRATKAECAAEPMFAIGVIENMPLIAVGDATSLTSESKWIVSEPIHT
eukprot:1294338-Prymnesium_polylepis.1